MKIRFTVWEDGHKLATELGLIPDLDSLPSVFEWYYTMSLDDGTAFVQLLTSIHAEFGCCHF